MVLQRRGHQEPGRPQVGTVPLGLSMIGCRANNGAETVSEHGSDHAMVRARLRLRMKADRFSNHPAKLDTAEMKTMALGNLRL